MALEMQTMLHVLFSNPIHLVVLRKKKTNTTYFQEMNVFLNKSLQELHIKNTATAAKRLLALSASWLAPLLF